MLLSMLMYSWCLPPGPQHPKVRYVKSEVENSWHLIDVWKNTNAIGWVFFFFEEPALGLESTINLLLTCMVRTWILWNQLSVLHTLKFDIYLFSILWCMKSLVNIRLRASLVSTMQQAKSVSYRTYAWMDYRQLNIRFLQFILIFVFIFQTCYFSNQDHLILKLTEN